eukprot:366301-Chlamydomonas_euryale.AAC.29
MNAWSRPRSARTRTLNPLTANPPGPAAGSLHAALLLPAAGTPPASAAGAGPAPRSARAMMLHAAPASAAIVSSDASAAAEALDALPAFARACTPARMASSRNRDSAR